MPAQKMPKPLLAFFFTCCSQGRCASRFVFPKSPKENLQLTVTPGPCVQTVGAVWTGEARPGGSFSGLISRPGDQVSRTGSFVERGSRSILHLLGTLVGRVSPSGHREKREISGLSLALRRRCFLIRSRLWKLLCSLVYGRLSAPKPVTAGGAFLMLCSCHPIPSSFPDSLSIYEFPLVTLCCSWVTHDNMPVLHFLT